MRRTPLTPIFDVKRRRGSIEVGNSPSVAPPSAPSTLSWVGRITNATTLNGAYAVAPFGDYVVASAIAGATDYLTVVDVLTPASPAITGSVGNGTTLSSCHAIAIYGDYAVLSCGTNLGTFTVVDLSTPASPSVAGSVADSTNFFAADCGIAVIGSNAFVSTSGKLGTISLATPSAPTFTNVFTDATNLIGANGPTIMIASGNTLFVGGIDRVTAVDVSSANAPSVISSLVSDPPLGQVDSLDLNGTTLLALDANAELLSAIDVSNPASMSIIGTLDLSAYGTASRDVRWVGANAAVVATGLDVVLVDASDTAAMTVVDDYPDDGFTGNPWRLCNVGADMVAVTSQQDDTVTILQVNY